MGGGEAWGLRRGRGGLGRRGEEAKEGLLVLVS